MDTLEDVHDALSGYRAILVIGPQRSGTTIGARMLAQDLGCRYIDEREHGNHTPRVVELLQSGERVVLQAPSMSEAVHDLPQIEHCAVATMWG